MPNIAPLLDHMRSISKTEREKGDYFERAIVAWLKADPVMAEQYSDAWLYTDWARQAGHDAKDVGIDVVAQLRHEPGLLAVQCKFYDAETTISKKHVDGFLAASANPRYVRRLLVDTTGKPIGPNASLLIEDCHNLTQVGLAELDESAFDWGRLVRTGEIAVRAPKTPKPHQTEAVDAVAAEFIEQKQNRATVILACGTGKTYTALLASEDVRIAGRGKRILFMVPSLALMSQTIGEWAQDATLPLRCFSACSDTQAGKRTREDALETTIHDLQYPATTDPAKLAAKASSDAPDALTVVYSTYQSIDVVSRAQKEHGLPPFDLIVCDEAHRTTGVTLVDEDDAAFVRIHDNEDVVGARRLYMTATPRVFGDAAKTKAGEAAAELVSMDDEVRYGRQVYVRNFGWAVENDLLTDYKVIVLAIDENQVKASFQRRLDRGGEIDMDSASKIIGCWKALGTSAGQDADGQFVPMRRAIAFARSIAASQTVADQFPSMVDEYVRELDESDQASLSHHDNRDLQVQVRHVDGTMGASMRTDRLRWLKEEAGPDVCRILTNARCLSEGVDVPALDAIIFLHERKSKIDIVQAIGRVMRKAPGKKLGYVILPVVVPAGRAPEDALKDNKTYGIIWDVLNALRSHDERLDGEINKASLGEVTDKIEFHAVQAHEIEVTAVSENIRTTSTTGDRVAGSDGQGDVGGRGFEQDPDAVATETLVRRPVQLGFDLDEVTRAIMAKIVQRCGRREYWDDWGRKVADIAQRHIERIEHLISGEKSDARAAFDVYLSDMRRNINEDISERQGVEMLAQHVITKPVFDVLFRDYDFSSRNPVSLAMQTVLDTLQGVEIGQETKELERFYGSVRRQASAITTDDARQKLIVKLYDSFFKNAFPKLTQQMGIVYTPVEVVDFIIASVDKVLRSEFNRTLGSHGVHIIDPFTGTGTFVTRLLQSGLITPDELVRKYASEIHANEIVLLAYYIAAINIEATYHGIVGGDYEPFPGICLTDTFQMYEREVDNDLEERINAMSANDGRRRRQKSLPLRVIIGNPPYSVGQDDGNDDAQNMKYPVLDARISERYAQQSRAGLRNSLYDSYIRAIRWASDRVEKTKEQAGVVAFVTNGGWIDGNAMDGMRKALVEEYSDLWIFHLRGNARTQGEQRRKEKGNVFGEGSRTPVAVFILVRNPNADHHGHIHYHDIGDYLDREQKLDVVRSFGDIEGIAAKDGWTTIIPDQHGDWVNQRSGDFDAHIALGQPKKGSRHGTAIYDNLSYSTGLKTNRDTWVYNRSKSSLLCSIGTLSATFQESITALTEGRAPTLDRRLISWSRGLMNHAKRGRAIEIDEKNIRISSYRPFTKSLMYRDDRLNDEPSFTRRLFPTADTPNKVICINGIGSTKEFSALITDEIADYEFASKTQCYPLYIYDDQVGGMFSSNGIIRRDGIADQSLTHFTAAYPDAVITKDDVFHYIYAVLHHIGYRERYASNLAKELPRIPLASSHDDFRHFVNAGRALAELHLGYETISPADVTWVVDGKPVALADVPTATWRIHDKMRPDKNDITTIKVNGHLTIADIPTEAYDYVVNGKPAIAWVIERQAVTCDKDSGIVNDCNAYAVETMNDPSYCAMLVARVARVGMETMRIVRSLPSLEL